MKICILLPYANPHTTGWIDEFIRITDHQVQVGIVYSVKKYRNNHFEEVDYRKGYLYFFKGREYKKLFYHHLKSCDYLITLGIFEPWFFNAFLSMPKVKKIFVLTEPFRPESKSKILLRKTYMTILRTFKPGSKFVFFCIGGEIVKKQYLSYGFVNSTFFDFGHFPVFHLNQKEKPINPVLKFIFVGKLIPRKGIDIVISFIKHLQKKYFNWEFLIVGDGELKSELLKACEKEKRIEYIENIKDAETMKSKFDYSDILFLPSYFDGWGAVVNEALSSCCSLLLSQNVYAGVPLLINGENGFSFNPNEINELYLKIDQYFANPEILNRHFKKSQEIFMEWNHHNAALSFNNLLEGKENSQNKTLLKKI